jgi:hypothetical protein
MLTADQVFVVGTCPECQGAGRSRNGQHFFYAICLICGGILCFFQWPPTPTLFATIWNAWAGLGLPNWTGTALIWAFTAVPPVFGLAFFWSWLRGNTCSRCNGRGQTTRPAVHAWPTLDHAAEPQPPCE